MEPFRRLSSIAIPIPDENIDTDIIFPARFLLIMERKGLGRYLFHDRRFTRTGEAIPGAIVDRPEYAGATGCCGLSLSQWPPVFSRCCGSGSTSIRCT